MNDSNALLSAVLLFYYFLDSTSTQEHAPQAVLTWGYISNVEAVAIDKMDHSKMNKHQEDNGVDKSNSNNTSKGNFEQYS